MYLFEIVRVIERLNSTLQSCLMSITGFFFGQDFKVLNFETNCDQLLEDLSCYTVSYSDLS